MSMENEVENEKQVRKYEEIRSNARCTNTSRTDKLEELREEDKENL